MVMFLYCSLDGRHVVFGQVVEGMETVRQMEKCGREVNTRMYTMYVYTYIDILVILWPVHYLEIINCMCSLCIDNMHMLIVS